MVCFFHIWQSHLPPSNFPISFPLTLFWVSHVRQLRMDLPFSWDGHGPGAMLTWHPKSFFPRKTVDFLSFFPNGVGRSKIAHQNTRKGDSKQIVTQITGQRHTEARVEMGPGKMVLVKVQSFHSRIACSQRSFKSFKPSSRWHSGCWGQPVMLGVAGFYLIYLHGLHGLHVAHKCTFFLRYICIIRIFSQRSPLSPLRISCHPTGFTSVDFRCHLTQV